jgi:hypothetical protein
MKKALIALFASLALALTTGGLGSAAQAAYPSTVATKSSVQSPKQVNSGKKITLTIKVNAGNAKITDGKVTVKFNGKTYTATVKNGVAKLKVTAPKTKKTVKKTLTVKYTPTAGSVYKPSTTSKTITVKKKKK